MPDILSFIDTTYKERRALSEWYHNNHHFLNISKTKEMIVDYGKLQGGANTCPHTQHVSGAAVERFRNLTDNHIWSLHTETIMPVILFPADTQGVWCRCYQSQLLLLLYHQNGCTNVWQSSWTSHYSKALQRVKRTSEHFTGNRLTAIQDIC